MARFALARRNEALDGWRDNFANGRFRVYSGTRPTNADTALSGNTLLAELTFGAVAFAVSSGGVMTANAIASATAVASGTASFVRVFEADGTTPVCDLSVGVGSGEVQFPTLTFTSGVTVSLSSLTVSFPVGA